MSNSLRNAAESTAHALSDLVEGARERIEELPPVRARRRRKNVPWMSVVITTVAFALVVMFTKRHRHSGDQKTVSAPVDDRAPAAKTPKATTTVDGHKDSAKV